MKLGIALASESPQGPLTLRDFALAAEADLRRTTPCDADSQEVLALWWGLVEGRWRLVEQFEVGGRRYYVAQENPPEAGARVTLEERERDLLALLAAGHSEKAAAQELGLSPSTISGVLKTALRKFGMSSRTELVRLLRIIAAFE